MRHLLGDLLLIQAPFLETLVLTINVPVVFMARYVMVLRSATALRGALEGVGPENRDFWAQKSLLLCNVYIRRGVDSTIL
jgi:hypothetical protein